MQTGDHQMMGNQRYYRAYVQKVIPVQPGGQGPPNATFQGQAVRVAAGQPQRIVQMQGRQVLQNGAGPHLVRQLHPGQQQQGQGQFQPNYGHVGTIAGRSAAAAGGVPIRTGPNGQMAGGAGGQQHVYRATNMSQHQQQGAPSTGQRAVYVTSSQQMAAQGGQVRYVQAHPQRFQNSGGQQYHQQINQQQQHHHRQGIQNPQNLNVQQRQNVQQQQPIRQMAPPPSQQQRIQQNHQNMQMNQILQNHPNSGAVTVGQHLQNTVIQNQNQNQQQNSQQQFYMPAGMNLTVPLREPSPEPVPIKIEEPEVPAETSVKVEEIMPEDMDIDIQIRNVVCNYTLPLHIDLRKLAMNTHNVTYEREKGVMMKQKRNPNCYIKVYSSGKVYIVGCRSELDCRKAARSVARHVQRVMGKLNEKVVIRNYRVNNVLATCRFPFGIKIEDIAEKYPAEATYEPELSVGLVWRSITPKATLRIHTTGSITVTGASSENDVITVLSNIFPIVNSYKCPERSKGGVAATKRKRKAPVNRGPPVKRERYDNTVYGNSGVVNNKVYFSDEEDDLYDDLEFDED